MAFAIAVAMKNTTHTSDYATTTYSLLIRSEEKERNAVEAIVYLLFTLCAVFSIWQAAVAPFTTRIGVLTQPAPVAQAATPQPAQA